MDDIQLLISGYFDGELTGTEVDRLTNLLQTDNDAINRLVLSGFVHSHLNDWMTQDGILGYATEGAGAVDTLQHGSRTAGLPWADDLLFDCTEPAEDPGSPTVFHRILPRSIAARAAMLMLAATLAFASYVVATRPVVVAQLTQSTGSKWAMSPPNLQVGALLRNGQLLRLAEGQALVTLVSGTQILLEAPATLRLDSANQVHLETGRIAAKVPTPAIGFTVTTPLGKFIDLGTMFTLKLDANAFDLYVFEGLVELQVDKQFGERVHQPLRIPSVRAVRFDTQAREVVALPFNQGETMPF